MVFLKSLNKTVLLVVLVLSASYLKSQSELSNELSSVHGNFQIDAQYYQPDSLIGAPKVPEKLLSNAFGNINYTKGKLSAGLRGKCIFCACETVTLAPLLMLPIDCI